MSIEIRELTHIYNEGLPDETLALDRVSFDVEDGQLACIIGHTGCGKSTLLQHINGLLMPKSGSIVISGQDITDPKVSKIEIRKKVGLVFQYPEYQLFEENVRKDVAFGPGNLGLSENEIEERVREAIGMVGLDYEEIKDVSPFDLSGGQKRRVAVAGVLAMRPEILILDEPVAGLDPKAHREMLQLIKNVHENISGIVLLVSHNMDDVAELADKVIVMDHGRVVMQGTPGDIFSRNDEIIALGLGLPEVTGMMHELKLRGAAVTDKLYSEEEAAEMIVKAINTEK
jgi:energy-coupling factor transport system ATP-binding protein